MFDTLNTYNLLFESTYSFRTRDYPLSVMYLRRKNKKFPFKTPLEWSILEVFYVGIGDLGPERSSSRLTGYLPVCVSTTPVRIRPLTLIFYCTLYYYYYFVSVPSLSLPHPLLLLLDGTKNNLNIKP